MTQQLRHSHLCLGDSSHIHKAAAMPEAGGWGGLAVSSPQQLCRRDRLIVDDRQDAGHKLLLSVREGGNICSVLLCHYMNSTTTSRKRPHLLLRLKRVASGGMAAVTVRQI